MSFREVSLVNFQIHEYIKMENKPNVLLIVCDQLRKDALGCYGNPVIRTPNIDRIAERGISFQNAYASYPVCAPSRGAMATGRYPSVNGLHTNGIVLPREELTFMEVLRRAGYATYGTGKTHLGPQWRKSKGADPVVNLAVNPQPELWDMPWYGFEKVWLTEDNRVGPYGEYLEKQGYDLWADPHSFTYPQHITRVSSYPEKHYQSTWITDRAIDLLTEHTGNKPFFLLASFIDPHHPFVPPEPFDSMYEADDMPLPVWNESERKNWPAKYQDKFTATEGSHEAVGMCNLSDKILQKIKAHYYGMVSLIDKQVGRILEVLNKKGWLDNTIVIFTSDHGELLGDHRMLFKGCTYQCVMNVPFIISGPGIKAKKEFSKTLTVNIDIMPTILQYCNIDIPAAVQGKSLKPVIENKQKKIYDELLIENAGLVRSLRTENMLLTWRGYDEIGDLFDLESDPHCLCNLWNNSKWKVQRENLVNRLMDRIIMNIDPVPLNYARG
jgi:arylsulfatase